MICPLCEGKHVILVQDERGEYSASPCSCLKQGKGDTAIRVLVESCDLPAEPYFYGNPTYIGKDKLEKESLLKEAPGIRFLWIHGPQKTQKTKFAVMLLRQAAISGTPVTYITMRDLIRLLCSAKPFEPESEASIKVEALRKAPYLVIDGVYEANILTFSTGIHTSYWVDFLVGRGAAKQTVCVSQYPPQAAKSLVWKGAEILVESIDRIVEFQYPYIVSGRTKVDLNEG